MKNILKLFLFFFLVILVSCKEDDADEIEIPRDIGTYVGIQRDTGEDCCDAFGELIYSLDTSYLNEIVVDVASDTICFTGFGGKQTFRYSGSRHYTGPNVADQLIIKFRANDTLDMYYYSGNGDFAGGGYNFGRSTFIGVKQ